MPNARNRGDDLLEIIRVEIKRQAAVADPMLMSAFEMSPGLPSGANGWAMTPSGTRGVLNNALSIYLADATLASAFVARWCAGYSVETAAGVFQVREDDPTPR